VATASHVRKTRVERNNMNRSLWVLVAVAALLVLSVAFVAAKEVEKTDGFVCPVLGGQAGEPHGKSDPGPIQEIYNGDKTVVGPEVSVPTHATNGDGAGRPDGPHSSPGDTDYTAVWAGQD
jgi:hypothetical protein